MDDQRRAMLEFVAGQSVFVAALIHLVLGVMNWLRWAQAGFLLPEDFRWPVFVVSGLALFAGLFLASKREDRRPFYVGGIAVMAGYVVGYFLWHLAGHRPLLLFGPGSAAESVSVQWFLDHLFADLLSFVAIFFEVTAVVVLVALLVAGDRS